MKNEWPEVEALSSWIEEVLQSSTKKNENSQQEISDFSDLDRHEFSFSEK